MAKVKRTILIEKLVAHSHKMGYNSATLLMAVAWQTTNKLEKFVNELINSDTKPTKEEIINYMNLHNSDEVGKNNQWSFDDAEYFLLLSDKYN